MTIKAKQHNKDKQFEPSRFSFRGLSLYFLLIGIFTYLYFNLINLQVVEGDKYYLIASKSSNSTLFAPRGLIYDSQGKKLAYNIASYSIYIKSNELKVENEDALFTKLAPILGEDKQHLLDSYKVKTADSDKNSNNRITIKSDLSYDQYFQLLVNSDQLKSVYVNVEPLRYYENGLTMANILGYIGDPGVNDVKNGINSQSQVGKVGIERYYDQYLRGEEGTQSRQRDPITKQYKTYVVKEAQPGYSLNLTIDQNWQNALYKALAARSDEVKAFAGAGVIINSNTGEVKAMVTYPTYDANLFSKGISSKDYAALINDVRTPLFNRPIALQLPSGSTWKVITATAALESGVINAASTFYSNRCMDLPGKITFCEADRSFLGEVNVVKALTYSSNLFFCNAAIQMNRLKGGPEYMLGYGDQYGLGKKTGIDLYGEEPGSLPSAALKKKLYNLPWYIGDDCNTVIGQGMVTVTPMQMAVVASAINNGGNVLQPHLVSSIVDDDNEIIKKFDTVVTNKVNASQKTLDIIKQGMKGAAEGGTANAFRDLPGNIIAKTGSSDASQVINGKVYAGAHSWTIGCFDYEGQNYCFAVMLQWGGRGYKSVYVMKNFINCLYTDFKGQCMVL